MPSSASTGSSRSRSPNASKCSHGVPDVEDLQVAVRPEADVPTEADRPRFESASASCRVLSS